jgi:aspartate/methionine/tyrosine aminotransferase
MLTAPRYLLWAHRFYGQVDLDLASSGMDRVRHAELGALPPLDDEAGPKRLRAAIARAHDVTPEEVAPALGASHALWLAYTAVIAPGDEVLIEAPSYEPVWNSAEGAGARVVRFERPLAERFALDPARVEAAMTARTRVVAVTNLHNPGGVRASDDALRALARIAAARGAYLLVDEVYAPFDALCDARGVWAGSARRLADNVITTGSLTKCYGAGWQRVGWLLGPPDVVARAEGAVTASTGMLPLEHANLGAHVLARLPELAARARAKLAGKRAVVEAWLATRPDLSWSGPDSGLFGFAAARGSTEDLTARIEGGIVRERVVVAPGAFFGIPNGFRLSWSAPEDKLRAGLAGLARVLA